MINLFRDKAEKEKFVSTHSDPFKSDKIESISFHIDKPIFSWDKGISYWSMVYFKNGNTKGNHKITAPDFISLVQQTELFIKNL